MNLEAILAELRTNGSPIIGVQIPDLGDSATWKFNGRRISAQHRADAIALITAALDADHVAAVSPTSAATFWPEPPTKVELDVAAIKQRLGMD